MTQTESRIFDGVSELQRFHRDVPQDIQIMKLAEEVGEAVQAYIGWIGGNPRKGVTNGVYEVELELADVAIAALVAIEGLGSDSFEALEKRIEFVMKRLGLS